MYDYIIERGDIKLELLHEQMQAATVAGLTGLSDRRGQIVAHFESEPGPDVLAVVDGLVTAHDPAGTTAAEDAQIEREATKAALVAAQAEQILDRLSLGQTANAADDTATATDIANLASVSNLADAKVVLGRMLAREQRALAREVELMTTLAKLIQFISREFGSR